MKKTLLLSFLALFALAGCLPESKIEAKIGSAAPDFVGTDSNGNEIRLSDFKGKNIVLEWTNHDCPFVVKHYGSGKMQKLQKKYTGEGVVWLSIVSSAKGKQGFTNGEEANAVLKEKGSKPTARILDPSGEIGRLYGARTTPHMFVVDKEGILAYAGAIDSDPSFRPQADEKTTNYVATALDSLAKGKEIEVAATKPYGCAIKY